ncbi:hypothetical protein FJZ18_01920 [Candidatus Pacearchaeota archaeon]|nr:hypothetical protein [Candidatus Pacearchaeota archaeon]
MAYETIFNSELAQTALVFVLVFTLVNAVLQKSKILGDGKNSADALVALAVGLLVSTVGYATDIIRRLVPFLGVSLVVILVFLLLVAIFFSEGKFELHSGVLIAFGIIAFVAVVIAVANITGAWTYVKDFFAGGDDNSFAANLILILVVVGAVFFALKYSVGNR